MKNPQSIPPLRLAFAGACLALTALCSAQAPQVLVYDGGSDDRGMAVTTDASGSIFVGGSSGSGLTDTFAVLKYNAAGTFQWLARAQGLGDYTGYIANNLLTDAAGNVYAAGSASKPLPFLQFEFGWLVASFDANGNQRWAQLVNGAGNALDSASNAALHPQQGLYVTGVTAGDFGRSDWLTIKYSLDGVEQWRRSEVGYINTDDRPIGIRTDAAGNAVVAGYVETSQGGPRDIRVIKYDPQGNILWRSDYSDTAISDEFPNSLALDAADNIYVVADRGLSTNPELGTTPITVKFDANGNRLFVLAGPGRGGSAIALDAAGNFIVSGLYNEDGGTNEQRITAKFTPAGALLWSLPFCGLNLAVDEVDGSVYLSREFFSFTAVKISSGGQLLWEQSIPEGNTANDALVDDATGAYILTGSSTSVGGNMVTARFAAGNVPPPPAVPAAPASLTTSPAKNALRLNWTDNANNETGVLIERSINGGAFSQVAQVGANVRTFNNTGLNRRNTYAYRVRAFNANGNSAFSNTATGVPR